MFAVLSKLAPSKLLGVIGAGGGVVARYLITSVINVVDHQILLQVAVRWLDWGGGEANVFASLVSVVPAWLLSRHWVWQVSGKPSWRNEVVPFWVIALVGLAVSTVLAEAADRMFDRPILISAGSLLGYGLVWVLKFVVLNFLFTRPVADEPVSVA